MNRIDYLLVYPDLRKSETEPSGGYVEIHITHTSHEAIRNIETAICLAKLGFKVRLMPIINLPGVKNPDAYLVDEQIIVEFKHNLSPTPGAIEHELRKAKKQADYVLIHVMSTITKGDLIRRLRLHIHRAKNIKEVWILMDEQLYRFTPIEIRNETIEFKIQ